jgi:hypothetical protein
MCCEAFEGLSILINLLEFKGFSHFHAPSSMLNANMQITY